MNMKQHKLAPPVFFSFHTQVYPFIIRFSVNQTLEQICNEDQIDDQDDFTISLLESCTTSGKVIKFEDNVYVCVIRNFDGSPDAHSVVAHEVHHICNAIFNRIGQRADLDNDECGAYLHGFITNQFYEGIKY